MTTLRVSKAEIPSELRESMIKQFGAVAEPVERAVEATAESER